MTGGNNNGNLLPDGSEALAAGTEAAVAAETGDVTGFLASAGTAVEGVLGATQDVIAAVQPLQQTLAQSNAAFMGTEAGWTNNLFPGAFPPPPAATPAPEGADQSVAPATPPRS